MRHLLIIFSCIFILSCGTTRMVKRSAVKNVLMHPALQTAHVGISVYEPAIGRYWYNYQGDKYFVPASNTKIPTCYAAMKYLGDSLVGARIAEDAQGRLKIYPAADPTFLHREFPFQPVFQKMKGYKSIFLFTDAWRDQSWGNGWSWNDYDAAYMAERSAFPVYGNVASFSLKNNTLHTVPSNLSIAAPVTIGLNDGHVNSKKFSIERGLDDNNFRLKPAADEFTKQAIPFRADVGWLAGLLEDTLHAEVVPSETAPGYNITEVTTVIHSQPTDSLLKPMMHRSDNFFAEQSLLMVSNEVLGVMNDAKVIDTLLKTDFKDLPQKPRWADGSGLSRYNLFTPQDFVFILNKMKNEFGMPRIQEIFPTGNEGTLTGYYKTDSSFFYAKTGTLSGVVALSGFIKTRKGKDLIVSVLVNNHVGGAAAVRRAVELFISGLRHNF